MNTSINGIELIKKAEGFRSKPYLDSGGKPTIGYGSRFLEDNTPVTLETPAITETRAANLMRLHVKNIEDYMQKLIRVSLNQNQFDALVCFIYNIGKKRFADSTLLKTLNKGNYYLASCQLLIWDHVDGKVDEGLLNRRKAEKALFSKAC